jgi:hypothetical protein
MIKNGIPSAPTRLESLRRLILVIFLTSTAETGTLGKKSEVSE